MNRVLELDRDMRVSAAEHVRFRQFDDELVMVDLSGGEYFALNESAARMWHLLVTGSTPNEVATSLAADFEASASEILVDCLTLIEELSKRGLVVGRLP